MTFTKLLEELKHDPGSRLDGQRSVIRLMSFLSGYLFGRADEDALRGKAILYHFSAWTIKRFEVNTSHHFVDVLRFYSNTDWKAFDFFWEKLAESNALEAVSDYSFDDWSVTTETTGLRPHNIHRPPEQYRDALKPALEVAIEDTEDLLTLIRHPSGVYLGEHNSFVCLISFAHGFEYYHTEQSNFQNTRTFLQQMEAWVQDKYGYPGKNLERIVLFEAESEEHAFDLFYQLFDEYCALSEKQDSSNVERG